MENILGFDLSQPLATQLKETVKKYLAILMKNDQDLRFKLRIKKLLVANVYQHASYTYCYGDDPVLLSQINVQLAAINYLYDNAKELSKCSDPDGYIEKFPPTMDAAYITIPATKVLVKTKFRKGYRSISLYGNDRFGYAAWSTDLGTSMSFHETSKFESDRDSHMIAQAINKYYDAHDLHLMLYITRYGDYNVVILKEDLESMINWVNLYVTEKEEKREKKLNKIRLKESLKDLTDIKTVTDNIDPIHVLDGVLHEAVKDEEWLKKYFEKQYGNVAMAETALSTGMGWISALSTVLLELDGIKYDDKGEARRSIEMLTFEKYEVKEDRAIEVTAFMSHCNMGEREEFKFTIGYIEDAPEYEFDPSIKAGDNFFVYMDNYFGKRMPVALTSKSKAMFWKIDAVEDNEVTLNQANRYYEVL